MTPDLSLSLSLVAPELMLAVGALVLLMIGAFSGERANAIGGREHLGGGAGG